MEHYQKDLTGYLLTTKIKDYLEVVQSDPIAASSVSETPNPELFTELSIKLDANITEHSLRYVDDLWRLLAAQFRLPQPMLLLHKIAEGCLTVYWRVLSNIVPLLRTRVPESASFFEQKQVLKVTLLSDHEESLYSAKGKRGAKVS